NIVLSSYVPEIIGAEIRVLLGRALQNGGLDLADIEAWAVHPGGRAIVDRLADLFALPADALAPTYATLRDYGNMSSPTILFVLRRLRAHLRETGVTALGAPGVAMAFGPGLVVEMARLRYVPAPDPAATGVPALALDAAQS
ncbi:MAG: hypothetical protein KDE20_26380, partial [Caldilineaceae bacterium]|nr:hypothetical protein [Caldilineaceae bacterium]